MNTRRRIWTAAGGVLAVALIGALALASHVAAGSDNGDANRARPLEHTEAAVAFREDMRKLWEDHVTWTRLFIVSFAADLPDQGPTTDRLLINQTDIGDAIKPFYGEQAGDVLTALLRAHILGAADLLATAKSGDTAAFDEARLTWYANGDEIATFLSQANPDNWPLEQTKHHMRMHLDLTLQEAANRLSGNYAGDIADYDAVHNAILEMADYLSLGIINQFAKQFR